MYCLLAMASSKQQHVVAVPLPAQGHLNPLMRFCKLLASQGVLVTFVNIDFVHHIIEELNMQQEAKAEEEEEEAAAKCQGAHRDDTHMRIRRAHVPIQGLNFASYSLQPFFESLTSIALPLEALILELNVQGPPVTCLVSDIYITSPTQDIADKLNIPRVVLFSSSASKLLLVHHVIQGDYISMQEVLARLTRRASKREVVFEGLPGLPTIYNDEAPYFNHLFDDNAYVWEFMTTACEQSFSRAHAFVVNSFEELEGPALTTLSKQLNLPIYEVGPLVEPLHKDSSTSLWKENEACVHWLEQQPPLSVLYISFGSVTLLTQTQFEQILDGLVSSKQRFLLVFRPGLVKNMSAFPLDILSRFDGKGYVVDWAPQIQVLSHPSVGGFLTHCGWNSTIEAISFGVPMLCWPYFADQFLDAKYIVEEWKVGLQFEASKDGSGLVESCEVERVVKALMEGEEGKALRENVMCLKEASCLSLRLGGTSYENIQALLKSLV